MNDERKGIRRFYHTHTGLFFKLQAWYTVNRVLHCYSIALLFTEPPSIMQAGSSPVTHIEWVPPEFGSKIAVVTDGGSNVTIWGEGERNEGDSKESRRSNAVHGWNEANMDTEGAEEEALPGGRFQGGSRKLSSGTWGECARLDCARPSSGGKGGERRDAVEAVVVTSDASATVMASCFVQSVNTDPLMMVRGGLAAQYHSARPLYLFTLSLCIALRLRYAMTGSQASALRALQSCMCRNQPHNSSSPRLDPMTSLLPRYSRVVVHPCCPIPLTAPSPSLTVAALKAALSESCLRIALGPATP